VKRVTFSPAIAIVACHRPEPNAHATLASMLLADPVAGHCPISVFLDSSDPKSFKVYRHLDPKPRFFMQSERADIDLGPPSGKRAHANYVRALYEAEPTEDGLIVVEDDVMFASLWLFKLSAAFERARSQCGEKDFLLSGYSHIAFEDDAGAHGVIEYPEKAFWGTCCLWWPKKRARWAAREMDTPKALAYDEFLGMLCAYHDIKIMVAVPNVVQHVGDVSVLHPTQRQRTSPTFQG